MAFPEYIGSADDRVQPASRRKEFLRGPKKPHGEGGEKGERERVGPLTFGAANYKPRH